MELLADRDPEEARKILDPVLERMMEPVHRVEGTVRTAATLYREMDMRVWLDKAEAELAALG